MPLSAMNDSLIRALRDAAAAPLPDGAFLRRDRGDALFITDAPRRCPEANWPSLMEGTGFVCKVENGLMRLWPDESWLSRLEDAHPDPPDDLCAGLLRFRGLAPEPESLALFTLGARCLDGDGNTARFDRLLRQRTAVCLRLNRTRPMDPPHGGGLYACALILLPQPTKPPYTGKGGIDT